MGLILISLILQIEDVQSVIRELFKCLKPGSYLHHNTLFPAETCAVGGLLILAEGNFLAFDENYGQLTAASENDVDPVGKSWFLRFMQEFGSRMPAHNMKEAAGEVCNKWIERTGLFGEVEFQEYFSPVGWDGHDSTDRGRLLGEISRRNCLVSYSDLSPFLLLTSFLRLL